MINLSLIGVAAVILLCALLAKRLATQPKASKSQRAEIIERLLALSEQENKRSGHPSSVRLRAPLPNKSSRGAYTPAIRSNSKIEKKGESSFSQRPQRPFSAHSAF